MQTDTAAHLLFNSPLVLALCCLCTAAPVLWRQTCAVVRGAFSAHTISLLCHDLWQGVGEEFATSVILSGVYLSPCIHSFPLPILNSLFFSTSNLIATYCPSYNYILFGAPGLKH